MYGWRARIGNISPTACSEILPYEFYRVAPEGVTFVSTNLVIRDARESSQVEAFSVQICGRKKSPERRRAGARSQTPPRPHQSDRHTVTTLAHIHWILRPAKFR